MYERVILRLPIKEGDLEKELSTKLELGWNVLELKKYNGAYFCVVERFEKVVSNELVSAVQKENELG